MNDFPFGFGPSDPDKRGEGESREPSGFGFGAPGGGPQGAEAFAQLGQILSQLGSMLSQAGSSSGPVNYTIAKQIALQRLSSSGQASSSDNESTAVRDAGHLAELWLDAATILPVGASRTVAWSARDWVEKTLDTWQHLCDPVAQRVANAWVNALPEEAKQAAGPLLSMMSQMGGMAFGTQLGHALAQLGSEVLTSTEVGLPLGPDGTAALLPANIQKFTEGLERPSSEVLVFLAAREAAHHRLFSHVPWLRQRLLATVEEFARGITVNTQALQDLAGQIDPANPASVEEALSSGLLQPQTTDEQKAALARLETLLALVEGWVDVVVADAVGDRLPGADALRETLRRRRASGGPAEQTFATLVGLELRPRRLRAASALWKLVGDQHGIDKRDNLWSHPDLMPTADDLDDPLEFAERLGADASGLADFDPIAELNRTEKATEDRAGDADSGDTRDAASKGTEGDTPGNTENDDPGTGPRTDG
ncbi:MULTISPECIES: zinc-dependent metalloprotease [Thermocrispum]|jgi:putative hydrolase|uniref:Zinc-dependent metalloprotease n=3 Tax=Thermocrispum agreste TaxID=37925 RepID=A0ABD6FAI0_9PSEU|nr:MULTISPECIES: zinc-dependent metalloprotease [Thermocrispum]